MAYYNQNFYNWNAFHNIPPPPQPPSFFVPPVSDQEFVKQFERAQTKVAKKMVSIMQIKDKMRTLVLTLNNLKENEKALTDNMNTLSEEEWSSTLSMIKENKSKIDELLSLLNDTCLEEMRRALAKRSAKRLRLKRLNSERKKEKEEMIKARREHSRRIDENLQKIKDDIDKVKQEEEAKLEGDSILRDTLRKKHDAKKCIVKLEALMKLRRARQSTARGRGEPCSGTDEAEFNNNIGKLISLWKRKLTVYEQEEEGLRDKLKDSQPAVTKTEGVDILDMWRGLLGGEPQFDFKGDVGSFLAVRSQWDQYISDEGTSLPVGWVVP